MTAIQPIEDRTIRASIPMASVHQDSEGRGDLAEFSELALDVAKPPRRQIADLAAVPPPVSPQVQKLPNVLKGEAEIARAADETQFVHITQIVVAVVVCPARARSDQSNHFVVADHLRANAARLGR